VKRFSALITALEETPDIAVRIEILAVYLRDQPETDRWAAIGLLLGHRPKRLVTAEKLRDWALDLAAAEGIEAWLFDACLKVSGDLAETIARILPLPAQEDAMGLGALLEALDQLAAQAPEKRREFTLRAWAGLGPSERLVLNRLLSASFRFEIGEGVMAQALSLATGQDPAILAHRLANFWQAGHRDFARLTDEVSAADLAAKPYPFGLTPAFEGTLEALGDAADWMAQGNWDGLDCQLVVRRNVFALWRAEGELITPHFPEFSVLADFLPLGTVIEGKILACSEDGPLPMSVLQKRLARRSGAKRRAGEDAARLLVSDLLEVGGQDLRALTLAERQSRLTVLLHTLPAHMPLQPLPVLTVRDWDELAERHRAARNSADLAGVTGLTLRRLAAPYRENGEGKDRLHWALAPFKLMAVLLYAQSRPGQRTDHATELTFAVQQKGEWVPVARADCDLADEICAEIRQWIAKNTQERFGPVRRVRPELLFELGFDAVEASPRHKAGLALRGARVLHWHRDRPPEASARLDQLHLLLAEQGGCLPPTGQGNPAPPPEDI
jgi:DNA ligase 1